MPLETNGINYRLQSGTLLSTVCVCYHDCLKCGVFRRTTGQTIILRHGSCIFSPLHAYQGWRRAQFDGLLQLELQQKEQK